MIEQQRRWLLKIRELFFQVGIKSVTMDYLATHLGISKKTLYQWVPNKQTLVLLLVDLFVKMDSLSCEYACKHAKNAIDELRYIRHDSMRDLEMMKANVVYDIKTFFPEAWDKMRNHQHNIITEVIAKNLKRGIAEGYYLPDLNIDLVSRLHGHQIFNLFDEDWFPSKRFASQEVIREFMRRYVYSIVSDKGRKYLEKYWDTDLTMDDQHLQQIKQQNKV